jgi:cell division initiation protein
MSVSPVELRHSTPARALLGYRRRDIDVLLAEFRSAYESVWRERAELEDRIDALTAELARHRESEDALRNALVSAERTAEELRSRAGREAELIVRDAERRAREIVHDAYAERERVRRETDRLRAHEGQFRARLRGVVGATLQALRDHEEWLAAAVAEAPPALEPEPAEAPAPVAQAS